MKNATVTGLRAYAILRREGLDADTARRILRGDPLYPAYLPWEGDGPIANLSSGAKLYRGTTERYSDGTLNVLRSTYIIGGYAWDGRDVDCYL